jgi:O-antigen ligase
MNPGYSISQPAPIAAVLDGLAFPRSARRAKAESLRRPMFVLLTLTSVSYWYCLPIVTQSLVAYSEFRGYDFLLATLMGALIVKYPKALRKVFRSDPSGRWIFRFTLWATATYPITALISLAAGRASWIGVSLITLFHLWGFLMLFAAIRLFVNTRRQCLMLLDVFLVVGALEAGLICLQGLGFVPRLWSELYDSYGAMAFSGTLGPNRTMPGHAMVLLLGVAFAYGRNLSTIGVTRAVLAAMAAVLAVVALGMTASRTSWFCFGVLLVLTVIGRRPQFSLIAFVLATSAVVMAFIPATAEKRIAEIYEWRVGAKLEAAKEDTEYEPGPISTMKKLDHRRVVLWTDGIQAILERPWLIPFGGGFNNYRYTVQVGVSAHNLYITLIGEVGLVGLFFYLRWLYSIWRESSRLIKGANRLKSRRPRDKVFFPFEMQTLLLAFMVSLLAGEILYPYRPAFACLGMFLFVCAVLNHGSLVLGDHYQNRQRVLR